MKLGVRGITSAIAIGVAGLAIVGAGASAAPQTATLGSTSGSPATNVCTGSFPCTYLPFSGAAPELQVPFDGTVTSFSVNSGSGAGTVELRVLRPAGPGKYTGAGTSSPEPLNIGMNTYTVSLPVKAGDVLGLDNSNDAILFANDTSAVTYYYELPPLADGTTAAPNHNQSNTRLLLSATVQAAPTGTTGPTGPTGNTGPPPTPPHITGARQAHPVWREGNKLATFSRKPHKHKSPVGTTFSFSLNEPALVSMAFIQHLTGRLVHGRCVAETSTNRSRLACPRLKVRGALRFNGNLGLNTVQFQGRISPSKKLPLGSYTVQIGATNSAAQASNHPTLAFKIVKR